jgi:hypothetical protein
MASDSAGADDASSGNGCPKCGETETEVHSLSTSDGLVGKMIDLPEEGFTAVSCVTCGYSELYRETDAESDAPRDLFSG